jgi:amidohydrolase
MMKKRRPLRGLIPSVLFFALLALPSTVQRRDGIVEAIVTRITPSLVDIRRDIHCHPELSMEEKRTAALAADYFRKLGLEVRSGIGGTGVLGILRGGKPGPVVGMRGDMDALPITEETGLPFASKEKGVRDGREVGIMHSCGHDIHTTVLLGVAQVLSELKKDLPGTVLFVAQPGEEHGDGAKEMLKAGLFNEVKPEAMFAYHVDDRFKAGTIAYCPGDMTANVDGFDLTVESAGCHGASPWSCVDPIVVGAQIVTALQVMVAREIDVNRNAVITVGSFHAGTAPNIIPDKAELKATVRNYGEDQRLLIKEKVERLVKNICEAAGAPYRLDYRIGIPSVHNDPRLLEKLLPTVERILGGKDYIKEVLPEMGGEDFSHFSRLAPSVMLLLGCVPPPVESTQVHSPTFIADEACIPVGVKVMSAVILDYLSALHPEKRER